MSQLEQRSSQAIEQEFTALEECTNTFAHQSRQYFSKSSREFNRYGSILAYEESRVILKERPWPFDDTDYINASYVDVSVRF